MPGVALITGVLGQDGSYLAERLLREGWEVHGTVRCDAGAAVVPGVVIHETDLADLGAQADLIATIRPSEIYNLAAVSSVASSWDDPVRTAMVNGVAAAALMDAAWRLSEHTGTQIRFVQASSAELFGEPDSAPQDESTPVRPVNPYGAAKAYAHAMAHVYRLRGLHVTSCILYNHESPRRPARFVSRKIAKAAAEIARTGTGVITLGNLAARRDWGWAPDYVDAMIRAARHEVADDYVIATGETHSVEEFARAALEYAGVTDWRRHIATDTALLRPSESSEQRGDATKARRELGWTPTMTFTDLVHRMVDSEVAA